VSTGQHGVTSYLIEVQVTGNYRNTQQTTAAPTSEAFLAAHPTIAVMIPATVNSTQGAAQVQKNGPSIEVGKLATAAGTYGDASRVTYGLGMKYTSKGTNPQGQVQLVLERGDATYYIKSNSISSLAFSGRNATDNKPKDVTIYTKASIFKIANGVTSSVEANVDAAGRCAGGLRRWPVLDQRPRQHRDHGAVEQGQLAVLLQQLGLRLGDQVVADRAAGRYQRQGNRGGHQLT
jgi:hypothetical protein